MNMRLWICIAYVAMVYYLNAGSLFCHKSSASLHVVLMFPVGFQCYRCVGQDGGET